MSNIISGTTIVENSSRSDGDSPVGSVVAWLSNLTGVPNLPTGWMLCDGSTVNDALSPMNGTTLPDLNGDNRFLRGADTGGATGGSQAMAHTHNVTPITTGLGTTGSDYDKVDTTTIVSGPATNTENRPPYYDVVWIIRIR